MMQFLTFIYQLTLVEKIAASYDQNYMGTTLRPTICGRVEMDQNQSILVAIDEKCFTIMISSVMMQFLTFIYQLTQVCCKNCGKLWTCIHVMHRKTTFGKNKIINCKPSGVQQKDDLNFSYLTGDLWRNRKSHSDRKSFDTPTCPLGVHMVGAWHYVWTESFLHLRAYHASLSAPFRRLSVFARKKARTRKAIHVLHSLQEYEQPHRTNMARIRAATQNV